MNNGNGHVSAALFQSVSDEQRLLERINDPKTAEALIQILDNIELIAFSVDALDGFLRRSEVISEAVVEGVTDVRRIVNESDIDLTTTVTQISEVATRLKLILDSSEFNALMESGVFAPKTVDLVGKAGQALVDTYEHDQVKTRQMGPLGLVKALADPDVQRGLAFLVSFGKRFGQQLTR